MDLPTHRTGRDLDAPLDVDFVRSRFPGFDDPARAGWVFAENAGGSYPSRDTITRLTDFYTRLKTQVGYAFPVSREAAQAMADATSRLAWWLGVDPSHLHVGPSSTQNTVVLAAAFGDVLVDGDAIVVTDQDHEANSGPWRRLASRGVEVREWSVDPITGHLDPDDLTALLADGRVRLVAFPHASNILGEINPVADLCATIREAGAVSVVDGVAFAPHSLPDVPGTGADVYLFSTYKTYGPHQGVMVMAPELVERLPNQGHFFNAGIVAKRLVPAGPDHAQVAALAGIADHLDAIAEHHGLSVDDRRAGVRRLWRDHETRILAPLLSWIDARDEVRVLGPVDPAIRVPTVAIAHTEPGADLAGALVAHRVMAAGGHFYAHRLVTALGIDPTHGVLRLSFVHNTTATEVSQVIDALDVVLESAVSRVAR